MDYHTKQLLLHCRVCGHRVMKRKSKRQTYECKAFAAHLQIAFSINTLTDNPQVHPERFCLCCHHSMQRVISARAEGVHHRCLVTPFVWEVHTNEGCTVKYSTCFYATLSVCKIIPQVCEHFKVCARGHFRRRTVGRGRQAGLTPNMLIAHLLKIAPPPIFSREPYPQLASQNSVSVLNELKCVVCSNILTRPLELPCRKLACTKCVVQRVAASSPVCPCCSEDGTLVPTGIRPAPNAVVILLKDLLVQCVGCHRDVKAGCYEGHECTPSLTAEEEREAAALLKRAISTSHEQGIIQLPTGGTVKCNSVSHILLCHT